VVRWRRCLSAFTQEYSLQKVGGSSRIAAQRDLALWPDGTLNGDLGRLSRRPFGLTDDLPPHPTARVVVRHATSRSGWNACAAAHGYNRVQLRPTASDLIEGDHEAT
jgi:hypothetical protein